MDRQPCRVCNLVLFLLCGVAKVPDILVFMQAVLDYFNLDVSNPVTGATHCHSVLCHAMVNMGMASLR